ncbi:MAG: hypothetical protein U9N84_04695 [Actinomycetota bacterium]|nr:hypothetical protein [Actinomycetota bacterium]
MIERDAAFLWETEALRVSPQRAAETDTETDGNEPRAGRWVTLREASRATAIPVETLRKWARRATVPTYLTAAPGGTNIRMVDLDGVERRATELGRTVQPATEPPLPSPAEPATQAPTPPPATAAASTPPTDGTPPGTMIVPIDAWNKMLNQLGNLHEAGQHLAEARERAAKAETEASFLRERLTEIRRDAAATTTVPTPEPAQRPPTAPLPDPAAEIDPPPEKVWQYLMRRVRDRG